MAAKIVPAPDHPSSKTLAAYERALEARYPGVRVHVDWIDNSPVGFEYKGWRIDFQTTNPQRLVKYGLASAEEFADWPNEFERLGTMDAAADEFGHHRAVHGIYTSKLGPRACFAPSVSMHVPDLILEGHDRERSRPIRRKCRNR